MGNPSNSMDEDPQSEITVIEGTPIDVTNSQYQYQYIQQQQLAQQAYTRQLQTLQHAEPVVIPGSSNESTPQQSVARDYGEMGQNTQVSHGEGTTAPTTNPDESRSFASPQQPQSPPKQQSFSQYSQNQPLPAHIPIQPPTLSDRDRHIQQLQSLQQQHSFSNSFGHPSINSRHNSQSNLIQISNIGGHSLTEREDITSSIPNSSPGTAATSAFFSPSSGSRFAPHTNLPSSVSSSYKSALPPNSYSSYTNVGGASLGNAGPFNSNFTSFTNANSSLNDRTGIYSNSSIVSRGFVQESTSPTSDAVNTENQPNQNNSSFKSLQPSGNVVRTSLLTSKLAASNANSDNSSTSSNNPSPSKLSRQSSFSAIPNQSTNFPYPNPRTSSRHNSLVGNQFQTYSSDPQNFSTSNPSTSFNRFSNGTRQFLPHPSSTTTTLSMEQVSAASSADANHQNNQPTSPMDTTDEYNTPSNSFHTSYESPRATSTGVVQQSMAPTAESVVSTSLPLPQDDHTSDQIDDYSHGPHLDIANHPVPDVLVMLTVLLQKIIDANDSLHPHNYQASEIADTSDKFTANVLAFHGRNIPAISLHAYLSRILKYCPTTNEVFISLLVYFDRIAQRANSGELSPSGVMSGNTNSNSHEGDNPDQPQLFVMDSYNIHRLIIAGVTVASKFFSDIFYKNSRYAKVGGLPVDELNHLELQFLLLTDFRLMITLEELQRYADLLLRFWQKEAVHHSPHSMATGP